MPEPMSRISLLLICTLLLSSCYKEPFNNHTDFMVGKWELTTIARHSNWDPTKYYPLPFDFYFEVEKKGILKEYINGVLINRWRVRDKYFREGSGYDTRDYLYISLFEFNSIGYRKNYEGQYRFYPNESRDTLESVGYLPKRIYSNSGVTFTFVKTE